MQKWFTIIAFLWSIQLLAQKEKAYSYINLYKDAAIAEMKRSGVPASITLAQGMLESGYGESELCRKSNNHFGIKCKNDWNGEKVYHDDDEKGECFRAYSSAAESYKDHSDFLKSRPWYAFLFKLDATDYVGWAKGLKKAGYATEKNYAEKLIGIIVDYNLQQHTLAALNNNSQPESVKNEPVVENKKDTSSKVSTEKENANNNNPTKDTVSTAKTDPPKQEEVEDEPTKDSVPTETVINPVKPFEYDSTSTPKKALYTYDSLFTINHAGVIYVQEGTAALALANKYNISLAALFSFNDMQPIDVFEKDCLIFLERKLKKGANEVYTAPIEESLYAISQHQGVQLEALMLYNKLKKEAVISKGTSIYLRNPAKPAATKPTSVKN